MLETDKGNALTIDHELTGICRAHSYHEHDIDVGIDIEQRPTLFFGVSGQRDHVDSLEHRAEIYSACKGCRAHYLEEMWSSGVKDVIMPVGF
jgi:hypothetical protein